MNAAAIFFWTTIRVNFTCASRAPVQRKTKPNTSSNGKGFKVKAFPPPTVRWAEAAGFGKRTIGILLFNQFLAVGRSPGLLLKQKWLPGFRIGTRILDPSEARRWFAECGA